MTINWGRVFNRGSFVLIVMWAWMSLAGNSPVASSTDHPTTTSEAVVVVSSVVHHHVPPRSLTRWDTRSTDPLASWPSKYDPMWREPFRVQLVFACIRWTESRNHSTVVEPHSHAGGWYQIMPHEWWYARNHIAGLPASAARATGDQQSTVALWYYHRNHGFRPEWSDGCK